jgi:hypothetical protein
VVAMYQLASSRATRFHQALESATGSLLHSGKASRAGRILRKSPWGDKLANPRVRGFQVPTARHSRMRPMESWDRRRANRG